MKKAGLNAFQVLRKRESIYKEKGLSEDTPEDELIRLLVEYPGLLERPIVEYGDKAVVARPIQKAIDLVG